MWKLRAFGLMSYFSEASVVGEVALRKSSRLWLYTHPRRRGRIKWQPTPVILPGESHGQRSLAGYSPRGRKESDMTERLQISWVKMVWRRWHQGRGQHSSSGEQLVPPAHICALKGAPPGKVPGVLKESIDQQRLRYGERRLRVEDLEASDLNHRFSRWTLGFQFQKLDSKWQGSTMLHRELFSTSYSRKECVCVYV